ncbi:MAG: two-component system, NtrC family, nitrogen regulation response regulator GlnG [Verrucomicrobiota bacterium]|jgi:DNA-binding response OmpR family regulator
MIPPNDSLGRILLADDENAFRVATSAFLRQQGYDCVAAPDAAAAAELLRASQFDLLISDIQMPGNAGLEFIEKLPQVAAGMPVILLTGHPSMQSAVRSVRLQVVAYLVKPCDPDELLSLARQAIANHRSYRAVSANRQRLESWARDLAQLEEVLRESPIEAAAAPMEAYVHLSLRNLLAALVDLKQFNEALSRPGGQAGSLENAALHKALQETIGVLEKTKQSFKSKELGELRKRLEGLLQTSQR